MARFQGVLCLFLATLAASSVQAADVFEGKSLYQQHCVDCHGPAGEGVMPGMPNFTRGESLLKSDFELANAVRSGRGVMPGFNGLLTDEELENVVAYLRTFL